MVTTSPRTFTFSEDDIPLAKLKKAANEVDKHIADVQERARAAKARFAECSTDKKLSSELELLVGYSCYGLNKYWAELAKILRKFVLVTDSDIRQVPCLECSRSQKPGKVFDQYLGWTKCPICKGAEKVPKARVKEKDIIQKSKGLSALQRLIVLILHSASADWMETKHVRWMLRRKNADALDSVFSKSLTRLHERGIIEGRHKNSQNRTHRIRLTRGLGIEVGFRMADLLAEATAKKEEQTANK